MAASTMTTVSGIMRQTCTTVTATMALARSLNQTWLSNGRPKSGEDAVQQAGARLIDPQPDHGVDDAGQRPRQDHRRQKPLAPELDLVDQRRGQHAEDGFRRRPPGRRR